MIVEKINCKLKVFNPITIAITIETKQELDDLCNQLLSFVAGDESDRTIDELGARMIEIISEYKKQTNY